MHELCRFMAKQAPVILVSFGDKRISQEQDGYRLEVFPAVTRKWGFTQQNPLAFRFLPLLRQARVIHVHQISTMVGDLACLAGKLFGIPVFVTDHGGGGGRILHTRLPIMRWYRSAVAQSDYARTALSGRKGLRITTIPGGIDLDRFAPAPEATIEPRILFVGRILPHKGVHILLEAFRHLQDLDLELAIVGRHSDPEYSATVRKAAAGLNVRFVESASDEVVIRFYQTSRVTVLPSLHDPSQGVVSELMGFTPLESLACGTPVIVSDAGALSEFVEQGKSGFVVPEHDPLELANAIRRTSISEIHLTMRRASCLSVQAYSWAEVVRRHYKLYYSKIDFSANSNREND